MRHPLLHALTALLVLTLVACDDSTNPNGSNPDLEPNPDLDEQPVETTYRLTTAFGPLDEHRPPFIIHGLWIQADMHIDPPLEADTDFHISIYKDGELVDDSLVIDMTEGQFHTGKGTYAEAGFYPGIYTIVATLDGEEIDRNTHDLRDYTGGIPAPDVTVTLDGEHITIDLGDFTADWGYVDLNMDMGSGALEYLYGAEYTGQNPIKLEYDPARIDDTFDHIVAIWAREQPYDHGEAVTTRYIHAFLPAELNYAGGH